MWAHHGEEFLAFGCEFDGSAGAFEDLVAESCFEVFDAGADGADGEEGLFCCLAEVEGVGDGDEAVEQLEVDAWFGEQVVDGSGLFRAVTSVVDNSSTRVASLGS